jgi:hypothetical protein
MRPDLGLLRPVCGLAPYEPVARLRPPGAFPQVSAVFQVAPPARFELALPPPEGESVRRENRLNVP